MSISFKYRIIAILREILFKFGFLKILHRIRNRRTLTVFMFHRVLPRASKEYLCAEREYTFSVDGFSSCLEFIKHHYNVVDLASVIETARGKRSLPPCAALITFDDGWRDTILYALPELKKHGMPGVLFLSTETIELDEDRWWQDAFVEIASDSERTRLLAQELGHERPETARLHELNAILAALPSPKREMILASYTQNIVDRQMLTNKDVASLDQWWLALAAHGHTHAPLTYFADPRIDLETSHELIRRLGGWPTVMSFPHGAFDKDTVKTARESGFEFVFTSEAALNSTEFLDCSRLFARIHIPENQWTTDFNGEISGAKLSSYLFLRPILFV